MRYHIHYSIRLDFEGPISEQQVELRLVPRQVEYQQTLSYSIHLNPDAPLFEHRDSFGNIVHSFSIIPAHQFLEIGFEAEVENHLGNPFDFFLLTPAEERADVQTLLKDHPRNWDFVLSCGLTVPPLQSIQGVEWPVYHADKNLLYSIQSAMEWIVANFRYESGVTDVHHPLLNVVEKRSGVCQDFAHLLIMLVRHWGFPARYVMGYQHLKSNQEEQPQATHAWAEIYLPGIGWRGFDATHQLLTNENYISVAIGRNSQDAAPERGSFKGKASASKPQIKLLLQQ